MTEQSTKASLYKKLATVAGAIGRVGKDGYNPQLKYRYPTPATVMEAVKPLLAEQHLAIVPQVANILKEPTGSKTQSGAEKVITRVEMTFLILDGESGESLAVPWAGEGEDWSDKGIAKAQTIALRTFLIQLFQIPSGDEETDPDARQAQPPQRQQRQTPQSASYEPPAPPANGNGKRQRTREEYLSRIAELTEQAVKLDLEIELSKPLDEMTREELIQHGGNLKAAIDKARAPGRVPSEPLPQAA